MKMMYFIWMIRSNYERLWEIDCLLMKGVTKKDKRYKEMHPIPQLKDIFLEMNLLEKTSSFASLQKLKETSFQKIDMEGELLRKY